MSKGGKKTKAYETMQQTTQGTTQSHSLTSPVLPDWLSTGLKSSFDQAAQLGQSDPYSYVAPVNALQAQAANGASNLGGSPWNYDAGLDVTREVAGMGAPRVQGASLLDGLDRYLNPMLSGVVDSTLADMDAGAAKTRAQQTLDIARQGAFGGSGAALTRTQTEGELANARASTAANLRFNAYDKAFGFSNLDADRRQAAAVANAQAEQATRGQRLQAAAQLGDLSAGRDTTQRANSQFQSELGSGLREIDQSYRRAPLDLVQLIGGVQSGLPSALFRGESTDGSTNSSENVNRQTNGVTKEKSWEIKASDLPPIPA